MLTSGASAAAQPDFGGLATFDEIVLAHEAENCVAYEWRLADDHLHWSSSAVSLFGSDLLQELASGRAFAAMVVPGSGRGRAEAVEACLSAGLTGEPQQFDIRYSIRLPDAQATLHDIPLIDRGVCHFDALGRVARVLGIIRPDDARQAPLRAAHILPNPGTGRRPLAMLVKDWLDRAERTGEPFGFALVAVDDIARLNDAYGFKVVDDAIEIFRRRLRAELRDGETMGRFTVGTFGLLLRLPAGEDLGARLRDIIQAVNGPPPHTIGGSIASSVTAGGLVAPEHAASPAEVFNRSQDVLHHARSVRRGGCALMTPALDRAGERLAHLRFADDIVRALDEGRVSLAYQPIAHAGDHSIAFHEVLVRVNGYDGCVFDGAAVIPMADRLGLTSLIDRRTLGLAFAALAADPKLVLSVNVSPTSLDDVNWIGLLNSHEGDGLCQRLIVEITESARMVDLGRVRRNVDWMHRLGCKVAIDDFGVGYTSFRGLRELNVDVLKIDGSFVTGLMRSQPDRHFVRALIELATNLGLDTVAEWVLDEPTAAQLAEWGCTYLQGELIGLAAPQPRRP